MTASVMPWSLRIFSRSVPRNLSGSDDERFAPGRRDLGDECAFSELWECRYRPPARLAARASASSFLADRERGHAARAMRMQFGLHEIDHHQRRGLRIDRHCLERGGGGAFTLAHSSMIDAARSGRRAKADGGRQCECPTAISRASCLPPLLGRPGLPNSGPLLMNQQAIGAYSRPFLGARAIRQDCRCPRRPVDPHGRNRAARANIGTAERPAESTAGTRRRRWTSRWGGKAIAEASEEAQQLGPLGQGRPGRHAQPRAAGGYRQGGEPDPHRQGFRARHSARRQRPAERAVRRPLQSDPPDAGDRHRRGRRPAGLEQDPLRRRHADLLRAGRHPLGRARPCVLRGQGL